MIFVLYRLISPTKSPFSLGKNVGGTRYLCEKNEPTLDRFFFWGGGGEHGKACWLIAYKLILPIIMAWHYISCMRCKVYTLRCC